MLGQKSDTLKKNASSTKNSDTELNRSKHILVKGPKPLQKLKFYLDIKNHAITSKLEGKIKELGGAVEFFLDREVTHVVSDRPECTDCSPGNLNSPVTPRLRSVESNNADSPLSSCESPATGRLRQKTRADAMLEKVRSQSTSKVRDPLQNAKLWGIPIWTVNKVYTWLERVTASITVSTTKSKKVHVVNIVNPFIKFEPIARNARPVYRTIKIWPKIDLDSSAGKPAFVAKSQSDNQPQDQNNISESNKIPQSSKQGDQPGSTNDSRMTRKQRTRYSVRGGKEQDDKQLVGGYCEICHCEYREIGEHVRSEQHLNFVKNDANFLELDSLISAGANVEAFLRLNGNSGKDLNGLFRRSLRQQTKPASPEKCNSPDPFYSPPLTRTRMPRTRSGNHPAPPPSHHLRSRGVVCTSSPTPLVEDTQHHQPKRTCPKTKRVSADERLVADNKTYYKVEVMTTKLRSSGLGIREPEIVRRTQTPIPEEPLSEEQSLVVKFRRVRRSELSVLNNEAENFMFPRKEDPSFSDIDTDEGPDTTKSPVKSDPSSDLRTSEPHKHGTDSEEDCETTETPRRKRKRTDTSSQEDTIDNMSVDNFVNEIGLRRKTRKVYTEIEDQFDESSKDGSVLGNEIETRRRTSRRMEAENLRSQSIVTSTPIVKTESTIKNNGDCTQTDQAEVQAAEIKKELSQEDLKHSFELLPKSDPWFSAFKRQDDGEEFYYTCSSDPSEYCSRFVLPYQLPYIIPLDPKVCISDYLKKRDAILIPQSDDATPGTSEVAMGEDSNSVGLVSLGTDSMESSLASSTDTRSDLIKPRRRKRKSRFLKIGPSHPRKSPRQHASTLAILSSLIQQRKKRERKVHAESDNSRASLHTIPEENSLQTSAISEEELKLQEQSAAELAKAIEDILSAPLDDVSEPEMCDLFERIEIKHQQDAIELIKTFDTELPHSPPKLGRGYYRRRFFSPIGNTTRIIRRKRKKNRTGWPKKKRLFVKREQKSEDGNGSLPELEDSRLTEISMEDENGELEMCELEPETSVSDDTRTENSEISDTSKIQGCTERVNCVEIESNVIKKINNVLVENINNNSELKLKNECTSSDQKVNNGVVEAAPRIPYNVTILECKKPQLKRNRNSSSDCSVAEEVIASSERLGACVNVTLDKWENAEKVLTAKVQDNETKYQQPFVKVQKIENQSALQNANRRLRSSTTPERKPKAKRARIVPQTSPRSPRKLRAPRGKWYRER